MENVADLAVIGFILLSGLWAFLRGFVREVLGVVAWVGAAFVTIWGFPLARPYARQIISIDVVADAAAGLALFIVSLILFSLVSGAISSRVRGSGLSALDRTLGFLFGLARGVVLVCLAYLVLQWAVPRVEERPAWVLSARTLPMIEQGAAALSRLVPSDARTQGAAAAERARREAERALDAERALRDLTSPPPKGDASRDSSGYNAQERRDLERLIQGKQ
jgi:membrane protein required for colicin V production